MASLPEGPVPANQVADGTKQKLLQAVEIFEYSKSSRQVLLDVDAAAVIEATALVGRTLRVYWPEEDAWFLGTVTSYNSETGEHHVDYVDGEQLDHIIALEKVRIMITQGAELPRPSPAAMTAYCTLLEQRAVKLRSAEPEESAELLQRAAELRAGTSVGHPDSENRCSAYRPGDVVWAKCRSFPPWPAMVVTRQLLASVYKKRPVGRLLNAYPLVYFGTNEYEWREEKDFTPMREGIDKDFHLGRTIKRRLLAAAICEVTAYMTDGEVPEFMFPCNDELESDSEEDEDEDAQKKSRRKGGADKHAKDGKLFSLKDGFWSGTIKEPGMPLTVGKTLTVLSLGKVEWLHPSFHDAKSIWPVGYTAQKIAVTPAAGSNKPKKHLCEILETSDGSGPIFRITPWGKPAVEARTPHKAWMALFESPDCDNTTLVVGNGARHFGLTVPQVASAIMALPGSIRCERFAGWPDGDTPLRYPPLNTEEERKRLAYEAAACRLPEGVIGISAASIKPGTCYVCFEEEEDEEDLILQCDGCGIFTHMTCYGVPEPPRGHLWLCDTCKVGAAFPPTCALCPIIGGALKRTDCGRWVHPSCVIWLPENTYLNPNLSYHNLQGLVTGLSSVHHSRRKLTCQICKMPHGACMQCCEPGCYAAFHIMCARQTEGYALQLLADSDSEEEEDDDDGEDLVGKDGVKRGADGKTGEDAKEATGIDATTAASTIPSLESVDAQEENLGVPSTSASGDENRQAAANGAGGTDAGTDIDAGNDAPPGATCNALLRDGKPTKKRGRPAAPPGTKKQKKNLKYKMVRGKRRAVVTEGTKINGARLVVYCPKHCPEEHVQPAILPALQAVVNTAAVDHNSAKQQQQQVTATNSAAGPGHGVHTNDDNKGPSGRSSAATTFEIISPNKRRRSLASTKVIDEDILEKASAAVAGWPAPLSTSTTIPDTNKLFSTYAASREMPFDGSLGRGPRAPEAMEAALAKRFYIEATPLLVRGPVPGLVDPPRSTCTWHYPDKGNAHTGLNSDDTIHGCGGIDIKRLGGGGGDLNNTRKVENPKVLQAERRIHQLPGPHLMCSGPGGAGEEDEDIEIMKQNMEDKEEKPRQISSAPTPAVDAGPAIVGAGATHLMDGEKSEKLTEGGSLVLERHSLENPPQPQPEPKQQHQPPLQPPSIEAMKTTNNCAVIVENDDTEEEDIMSKPITMVTTTAADTTTSGPVLKTAKAPQITTNQKTVLSSTERYREMRATEGLRIAPGKSAIHGWGAFARLPHSKDQMVIEYVGDLVRPSVADARERQVYDSLVGAGTYVFRVNMDRCVDATRSGNLAHLLNHSCEPNCYSRTVPVWDREQGAAVDHVVIFAAREICAWEELTYDYRFSGEEKLVCNCGAGRCRGMVNQASTGPGGGVSVKGTLVPKSKVKYPFRNT